jgi:hypothetical protein
VPRLVDIVAGLTQRIDMPRQQIRASFQQIDGQELRAASDPIAAIAAGGGTAIVFRPPRALIQLSLAPFPLHSPYLEV